MHFDVFTVLAASLTVVLLLALQFTFFWTQDRRSSWLAWLVAPFLLGAAALALFIPRGRIPDLLSIGLANALLLLAFGYVWQGMRIFERRRPLVATVFLVALAWLALCLWPSFLASLPLRVVASSAGAALFGGLAAWELWRGRSESLPSRLPTAAVLTSFAAIMLLRIPLVGIAPFPVGGLPIQSGWTAAFNLVVFMHVASFAVLMISVTKERLEQQQRSFAMTDPLTGLLNRRAFAVETERVAYRPKFGREQTSLLVLDLDHFKSINDRFGHDVGDRMLLAFTSVAQAALRHGDSLYRLGGEEFCAVLPATGLRDAISTAEQIRRSFEFASLKASGEIVRGTVSIGIATTDFTGFELEAMLAAADAALYEAKARGRNRIVVAEPTSIPRPLTTQPLQAPLSA
jgi:diguanylate cyclase (GGDEF)-like protein